MPFIGILKQISPSCEISIFDFSFFFLFFIPLLISNSFFDRIAPFSRIVTLKKRKKIHYPSSSFISNNRDSWTIRKQISPCEISFQFFSMSFLISNSFPRPLAPSLYLVPSFASRYTLTCPLHPASSSLPPIHILASSLLIVSSLLSSFPTIPHFPG